MDHPENQNNRADSSLPPRSPPLPYARACVVALAGLQACRRTGLLRDLTCRSCLSGREARREFCGKPRKRRRRLPAAKRRVAGIRVFFGPVSWRESGSAAGPRPGNTPGRVKNKLHTARVPRHQDSPAHTYTSATKPTKQPLPRPPTNNLKDRHVIVLKRISTPAKYTLQIRNLSSSTNARISGTQASNRSSHNCNVRT